jgi:hypothetical protein
MRKRIVVDVGAEDREPLAARSQIQALDRTQPGLPMKRGRVGTMTHDHKRNGTTTLFAALNILEGTVIGRCMRAIAIRDCKPRFALGTGWYVVLDEGVRRALGVVRRAQSADRDTRRQFARNPRSFLR